MLNIENWTNYSAVSQPVTVIVWTHLRLKLSGVSKEEGNGVATKKGRASVGKIEGL